MSRQPKFKAVYQLAVGVWLTLSVLSVLLAAYSWVRLSQTILVIRHWESVGPQLGQITKTLLDSETTMRGFLITGDPKCLDFYKSTQAKFGPEFDSLATMTENNPDMFKAVLDLQAKYENLSDFNDRAVSRRKQSFDSTRELVASGEGKKIMDDILGQISGLIQMFSDQRTKIRENVNSELSAAILTSLVAGIFGVIAGVFAFRLARAAMKHQVRQADLIEAMAQCERSSREKSAFLANMSHEIRTPMNAILGFSELLETDVHDTKHLKYVQSIRFSATSLLQLINDILDMSKIEAGVLELHLEPTDSTEICDIIQTLFSEPALKKGIQLKCDMAPDLPRSLLLDRVRLRQILVNLVGNAIKFTDHGSVEVRMSSQNQSTPGRVALSIEVADTGVGIPQDRLDAIFKPFVQAGVHREKESQGTGLGLAIVKRLTELIGGTVTVTSVPGQGSVFKLLFPNVPVSVRVPVTAKVTADGKVDFNRLHAATLLVTDDNEGNRQYIDGIFRNTHHRLIFCTSGEEAIDKARETIPDIVLLDVRMPGMDGRQALAEIRKIPGMELVPAIAVTGSGRQDGFSGYVRKPFTPRELFDELSDFLPRNGPADLPGHSHPETATDTVDEPVSDELLSQLGQLLVEPWPDLCNSMAVNETKTFACRLEILAEQWHCKPLTAYAGQLRHDAETYAVSDLEKHLGEFAALVAKFAQHKEKKSADERSGSSATPPETDGSVPAP